MKKILFVLFLVLLLFGSCASSGGSSSVEVYPINAYLKDVYADYFDIGAAVVSSEYGTSNLFDHRYLDLLPQYSSLTAENAMKPAIIHPTKTGYNWAAADRIADYTVKNGKKLRGHVLVWHNQTASWMTKGSKKSVRANMKSHIDTVMARYKHAIYSWDVVNEAIADGGGVYREDSSWFQAYGDATYIQDAFTFARAADPDCKLFYNDYSVVDSAKRDRIVKMIEDLNLKAHGLDGIGMQAHWRLDYPSLGAIQQTIDTFHNMGLEIHITELDIDCFGGIGNIDNRPFNRELAERLATRYEEIFALFRKNSTKISSVTFWGIADDHTWLDYFYNSTWNAGRKLKNYPFVFDRNHRAKKAFKEITEF
ncbi:MAG: endo-1,4-beta-xylanase [Spirochaetes bacterium]|jgi:endo-1,4-beta-xylanase|nr:endo-1,4-beta-xylanase [Spirochaetota bacterium]